MDYLVHSVSYVKFRDLLYGFTASQRNEFLEDLCNSDFTYGSVSHALVNKDAMLNYLEDFITFSDDYIKLKERVEALEDGTYIDIEV